MLLNRKFLPFVSVAVATSIAAIAHAAVTFDATTGTGFVGKGDVQTALGLNNAQLQAQAESLTFTYSDTATYNVPCQKETAGRKETHTLENTFKRKQTVNGTIDYDARKQNQVNGFNLKGFGSITIDGKVACPGGWDADGEPEIVSTSGGVLEVNGIPLQ